MRAIVWLRRFDYLRRWRARHGGAMPPRIVYYLHIGKTGGSFLKTVLKDPASFTHEGALFIPFGHNITQAHLPAGASYFFATRDPLRRYVSGFYSRKRKGRPTSFRDWSKGEARAFARFETANALAEALDDADPAIRAAARDAMAEIRHVREFQADWLPDMPRLEADLAAGRARRIRQEDLNAGLAATCAAFDAPLQPGLLDSRGKVHANAYDRGADLTPRAEANLRSHYARDYAFLARLEELGA